LNGRRRKISSSKRRRGKGSTMEVMAWRKKRRAQDEGWMATM